MNTESASPPTSPPRVSDLRLELFMRRAEISDDELERMADADVPGAETEIALRATLKKTGIKRESVKPHCCP